jgi:alkanesulfonate monooxygenase SsuD/methylene tetrahydromethanopterin reductase-like flavin-dependent oxidoreductase (luciferase family)
VLGFAVPQYGESAHADLARQLTSVDVISRGRLLAT